MLKTVKSKISGNLDMVVAEYKEEIEGQTEEWKEILIHGDSEGLQSLAKLLLELANLNQESQSQLPSGAREHFHLRPNLELAKSSNQVIVGRLDAKGTGEFYKKYIPKS
jgi:ParB-like chromosome segregation protein Spo0J